MPVYDFECDNCHRVLEIVQMGDETPHCCNHPMRKKIGLPALIRIKGQGYPSRRKWMDNWTPQSPPFPVSSLHGEKR